MVQDIKLGTKVRDKITDFEGIAITKAEFLNGCVQYEIMPKVKKGENRMKEGVYIDSQQLEIIEEKSIKKKVPTPKIGGGMRNYP